MPTDEGYNGAHTGAQIDAAISAVRQKETTWDGKQDKLTGTAGQVVGFDSDGNAIVQDAPSSGMTQEQADARYLKKTGGGISGNVHIDGGYFSITEDGTTDALKMEAGSGDRRLSIYNDEMDEIFSLEYDKTENIIRLKSSSITAVDGLYLIFEDQNTMVCRSIEMSSDGFNIYTDRNNYLMEPQRKVQFDDTILAGLQDPTDDSDAATKGYVDNAVNSGASQSLTCVTGTANSGNSISSFSLPFHAKLVIVAYQAYSGSGNLSLTFHTSQVGWGYVQYSNDSIEAIQPSSTYQIRLNGSNSQITLPKSSYSWYSVYYVAFY